MNMRSLSGLGIGFSAVFGFLFLALIAEIYYLLWWKKRVPNRHADDGYSSSAREFVDLFCWKKTSSLSSCGLNPTEVHASLRITDESAEHRGMKPVEGEDGTSAETMMVNNIPLLPRILFTIKEETNEDLDSEDDKTMSDGSRKSSKGSRWSDVHVVLETPQMTPISSPSFYAPPPTPIRGYSLQGFNPLFEPRQEDALHWIKASSPPKSNSSRDAEENPYKKEALMGKSQNGGGIHQVNLVTCATSPVRFPSSSSETSEEDDDGSFITINVLNNQEKGSSHAPSSSSSLSSSSLPSPSQSPLEPR